MTDVTVQTGSAHAGWAHASDTPARITLGGGGAGGNVAAWLGHLGVAVGLVACVGDDDAGRVAVAQVERHGVLVRARADPSHPTGTVVALIDDAGERTMLTDRGANVALAADDLPRPWLRRGAHLHLSGYVLFDEPARGAGMAALALAADAGMTISIDPASWAPLRAVGPAEFLRWTAAAQLCLPNADEAAALTGERNVGAAALRLGAHYGQAVVTSGGEGAVWSDGASLLRRSSQATVVGDATGAGDAFAAGYLAAQHAGVAPDEALRQALRTADEVVGVAGARPR